MSEMEERVAKAMLAIVKPSHHSSDIRHVDIDDSDIDFKELARAAIEAIREHDTHRPCTCQQMGQMATHQRGCQHWRAQPWPC